MNNVLFVITVLFSFNTDSLWILWFITSFFLCTDPIEKTLICILELVIYK